MPLNPTDVWTREDSAVALAEGWDVFDVNGGEDMQIQRIDCTDDSEPVFDDDLAAWKHVRAKALERSELHLKALRVISLDELTRIERALGPSYP